MNKPLRVATAKDLKVGTVLIDSEGYTHSIRRFYSDGIWETQNSVIFSSEIDCYKVKVS